MTFGSLGTTLGSLLRGLLADGTSLSVAAGVALVAVEVLLRRTGFARPDTVNLDLEDRPPIRRPGR